MPVLHLSAAFLLSVIALLPHLCTARPQFLKRIPNGDAWNRDGSGITCQYLGHNDCEIGAPRNPFGQDFEDNGLKWDKVLCEKDSDGDGLTNGEELGDPCCEWSQDNPTDLRLDTLSHPGNPSEDGAKDADGCKAPDPTPPPPAVPSSASPSPVTDGDPAASASPSEDGTDSTTTDVVDDTPVVSAEVQSPSPSSSTNAEATQPEVVDENTPEPTDDGVCFPGHATVKLESGRVKSMRDLEIGDRVEVARGLFSDVFLFTHKMQDVIHEFVTIRAGSKERVDATVTLTHGHFLYVNGKLATAGSVVVGDQLELSSGKTSTVIDVSCALHKGLFNPQTTHGDLIVDSVRVSTYTTAIQTGMAHSLLAPLRILYRFAGWTTSAFEAGADRIVALLP